MYRFFLAFFKLAAASLMAGAALSFLNLSAGDVLAGLGMTPDRVFATLERGAAWAIPNLVLGSMVVLPVWFVVSLLRPPRG